MKRKRRVFQKDVAELDVKRFKFLDESSVNMSLTRLYGRAAPDQRVVDSAPQPSGPQTTTLAVIGWTGSRHPWFCRARSMARCFMVISNNVLSQLSSRVIFYSWTIFPLTRSLGWTS